ncbi:MAG TPA: DUF3352 domain-containing protein [Solirubrobacterales bacterium]|nr:DUF3352 domain-containing protein [Solirubrobacterales bacterium]
MPRRSLSDLRYALRRRARRGRYALEDLGYTLRRSGRRISAGLERRRSALTLRTQHRIVAGLTAAIVLLLLVVFAVPSLPCQAPGGSECQPDDEAIALVPGDSSAYVHVDTDRDTEQYERAIAVAERLPAVSGQIIARLPAPSGVRVDYRRDVAPWLGGEAALALISAGDGTSPTVLLEIGDQDGASRFVQRLAGGGSTRAHRGVDVIRERGIAVATVDDFVVAGREAQVKSVIDTGAGGPTLADAGWVDELRDGFPDLRLAELLVSEDGAGELFAPGAPLGSFEAFVDARATRGAGAALVATDNELELDVDSLLDPERAEGAPGFFAAFPTFDPSLADEASENALAYMALGSPARSVAGLFAQATAESPGLAAGFEQFAKRLRRAGDLSLERELLPLLSSEAAVWLEPRGAGEGPAGTAEQELPGVEGGPPQPPATTPTLGAPFVTMVVDEVDSEQATRALARLQRPIATALDPGRSLQAPVFEQQRIDGVEAQSLRVSPTVTLTYAATDGRLVISTDPAGVRQVLDDGSGLEGSERFEHATDGLPGDVSALAYLNLEGLLRLAELAGLGADPAYASFSEELGRLDALAVAVRHEDDEIDTELRLTVGG